MWFTLFAYESSNIFLSEVIEWTLGSCVFLSELLVFCSLAVFSKGFFKLTPCWINSCAFASCLLMSWKRFSLFKYLSLVVLRHVCDQRRLYIEVLFSLEIGILLNAFEFLGLGSIVICGRRGGVSWLFWAARSAS